MASNLPAVLSPNETFALTLRNILAGNAQSGNPLMEIRKMSSGFNNNGSEGFLGGKKTKMVMDALTKAVLNIEAGIEAIEKGINKLVDKDDEAEKRLPAKTSVSEKINKSMSDVNGKKYFEAESEADAQKKREVKQLTLLSSILEQLRGGGIDRSGGRGRESEDDSSFFGGGLMETFLGTGLAMKVGSIGKKILGAGSMLFKGALRFIALPATLITGIYGSIFEAEEISGEKNLASVLGFGKRIAAGVSNALSFITFGIWEDKEIYNFITSTIPKNASIAFNWIKGEVLSSLTMFDEQMGTNIVGRYKKLTKGLSDMLGMIDFSSISDITSNKDVNQVFEDVSGITVPKTLFEGLTFFPRMLGNQMKKKIEGIGDYFSGPQTEQSPEQLDLAKEANKMIALEESGDYTPPTKGGKPHYLCAAGTTKMMKTSGLTKERITGDAYTLADKFASRSELSEITPTEGSTDYESIKSLKPGSIVVYGQGFKGDFGHAAVIAGQGKEFSDRTADVSHSIANAKEKGRSFRVFVPRTESLLESTVKGIYNTAKDYTFGMANAGIQSNLAGNPMLQSLKESDDIFARMSTSKTQDTKIKQLASESAKANKVPVEIKYSEPQAPVIINNNTTTSNMPTDTSTSFIDSMDLMMIKILSPIRKF